MPNGEQFDLGVESEGGNIDSDYVDDSEESEDDSDDSEEGNQSPPRPNSRSKQRHDPTTVSNKTLASNNNSVKHDRTNATDSVEKVAKQPTSDTAKPWKALPRMRIVVLVASA